MGLTSMSLAPVLAGAGSVVAQLDLDGYFTGPEFLSVIANLLSTVFSSLFAVFITGGFAG